MLVKGMYLTAALTRDIRLGLLRSTIKAKPLSVRSIEILRYRFRSAPGGVGSEGYSDLTTNDVWKLLIARQEDNRPSSAQAQGNEEAAGQGNCGSQDGNQRALVAAYRETDSEDRPRQSRIPPPLIQHPPPNGGCYNHKVPISLILTSRVYHPSQ